MADIARLFNFLAGTVIDSEQVDAEFDQLVAAINDLDPENLRSSLADKLGVSAGTTTRRGKTVNTAAENVPVVALGGATPTSAQFGSMPTPDRITGLVAPADALIAIEYGSRWQMATSDVNAVTRLWAQLFIGGNPVKFADLTQANTPWVDIKPGGDSVGGAGIATYSGIARTIPFLPKSSVGGEDAQAAISLLASSVTGTIGDSLVVPAIAGNLLLLRTPPGAGGTWDIEVKWVRDSSHSSSGTVRDRSLHAWALGF